MGAAAHPLDKPPAEELRAPVAVAKAAGRIDEASRLATLTFEEPTKAEVRAWKAGQPFTRRAQAVVKQGPRTFVAVVDLDAKTVAPFAGVEGMQAGVLVGKWQAAQAAALAAWAGSRLWPSPATVGRLAALGTYSSSFALMPMNFFDRNPQISLAKPRSVAKAR